MPDKSASNPPCLRISAESIVTKIVTIITSNILFAPPPIEDITAKTETPSPSFITIAVTIPVNNTTNTFIPIIPPIRTKIYGINNQTLILSGV